MESFTGFSSPHLVSQVSHSIDQTDHDYRQPEDPGHMLSGRDVLLADLPAHCPGECSNWNHRHAVAHSEDEEHNAPAKGVTFWEMSQMSTGKTSDTAQGAQPRAKKTPRVKAPMKAEYWKRPMEK